MVLLRTTTVGQVQFRERIITIESHRGTLVGNTGIRCQVLGRQCLIRERHYESPLRWGLHTLHGPPLWWNMFGLYFLFLPKKLMHKDGNQGAALVLGDSPCWPESVSVSQSRYLNVTSRFPALVIWILKRATWRLGFPGGSVVKNLPANAGDSSDSGSVPGLGRSLRGGNGNPLQYSCLGDPMDRGAWWATVQGSQRVGYHWGTEHACVHEHRDWIWWM